MRTLAWLAVPTVLIAMTSAAPAAEKDDIQKAVDRGVAFLKSIQQANGTWQWTEIGATPLAGIALLECGVKPDDPAVQKAATAVRENCITLTHTYSLSLCIMFLDRLGDPADVPLIESMAVRLLAGQNAVGGWTYNCPGIGDNEVRRLAVLVKNRNELVAGRDVPKPGEKREVKDLPKEIQLQLLQIQQAQGGGGGPRPIAPALGMEGGADNSNTQFATLALWVARRHGIPADQALAKVDARFRSTQGPDGGWNYSPQFNVGFGPPVGMMPPGTGSSPAMTCAGLLGLAAGHGVFNDAAMKKDGAKVKDPNEDKVIKAGLIALGSAIGNPLGGNPLGGNRPLPPAPGGQVVGPGAGAIPVLDAQTNGRGYYFLWSLERVGVTYGLDTIGNKDWYAWGCEIILRNQQNDGSWRADYSNGGVDTSFALLFLRRANLAQDLTATLKGRVQDPEKGELKAGGVGGADLVKKGLGLKPAFETGGARKTEVKEGPVLEGEAAKLAEEVLAAQGKKQEELLEKLRDGKGVIYTQALTGVIPKLSGQVKGKAREVLAERLTRMTAATLKDKLADDDLEVRRAAALAVALKEDRTLVPRLIEMLTDPEPPVANAALAALQTMTKQNFGPDADATRAEREKAVSLWKAWWAQQGNK